MSDFRVRRMIRRNEDLRRKQVRQQEKRRRLYEEEDSSKRNQSNNNNEPVGSSSPGNDTLTNKKYVSAASSPPSSKWISTKRKHGDSSSQSPSNKESPIKSIIRGEEYHHQSRTSCSSTKNNKRKKSSFGDSSTFRPPIIDDKWLDEKPESKRKPTKRDGTPQKESPIKILRDQRKASFGTTTTSTTKASGSKGASRLSIDDKWLDSPRPQRRIQMEDLSDSEKMKGDAATNAKSAAAASEPNSDDDGSDSDDSFDLLKAFQKDKGKTGITAASAASSPLPENDARDKGMRKSAGQKRELYPGEKKELYPGQKKELYTGETRDDSQNSGLALGSRRLSGLNDRRSSCSSSHDSENSDFEAIPSRVEKSIATRKIIPERKSTGESDNIDDDEDDNCNENKNIAHNPITLMKAEDEKYRLIAEQNKSRPSFDDDDLWDDGAFEENEKGKSAENKKKRGRVPNTNKKKAGTAATSKKQRPSKSPSDDVNSSFDSYDHSILDDDDGQENVLGKDENDLKRDLHPEFAYPPFGPYELEPLVLKNAEDNEAEEATCHQVPAALSRYIAPFQRVGIEFMYRCLSAGSGAIMGDEMGLGKTLQVLALLTALFNKTGTAMDLSEIQKRKQTVWKRLEAIAKEKETALLEGRTVNENPDWKAELSIPEWYPVLVIVPATLIENWKKEFARFTHFSVAEYRGTKRCSALSSVRNGTAEILLTAHSTFRTKADFEQLNSIAWKLIAIDEFHVFKNPKKKLSECLRELKATNPTQIIGMTGTLMQNNHEELWNLVDLIETNFFGTWKEFESQFSRPIKIGRTKGADPSAVERSSQKADALSRKLDQIMIDRKKEGVLKDQLPEKAEKVVFCELSTLQKRVYRHILQLPDFELVKTHAAPCDCDANKGFFRKYFKLKSNAERVQYYREHKKEIIKRGKCCYTLPWNPNRYEEGEPLIDPDAALWRTQKNHTDEEGCEYCPTCIMLPAFNKLNKASSHLALLQPKETPNCQVVGSNDWASYMKELEFAKVALPEDVVEKLPRASLTRKDGIMDNHFQLSGKLKVLDKLLRRFQNEEIGKTLIFSYSTQTLDLIQNYVASKGFSYDRMDGDTNFSMRQAIADRFNSDEDLFVLLLSTKAMGLGLNLTSASKVVIFDVEWNPSWDQQAQDRAYRIGQKNNVEVFRLVSQGTLDELRYLRQCYKVQLKQATMTEHDASASKAAPPKIFRGVQGDSDRKGELFGCENLFKFKDGCFLDEVWKQVRQGKAGRRTGGLNIHDTTVLAEQLGEIGEEKCKNILSLENEELDTIPQNEENLRQAGSSQTAENPPENESEEKSTAPDDDALAESKIESTQLGAQALNHEDLFREDRGGAAVEMGDDDYEVELGGGSQNALLIANEQGYHFAGDPSDNEDGNDESNNIQTADSVARMPSIKEEKEQSSPNQKRSAARPNNKPDTVVIDCDSEDSEHETSRQVDKDNDNAQSEKLAKKQKSALNSVEKLLTKANDNAKRRAQQQGPTVNLMGKSSTKNVETSFSMADLPIPDYKKNNGKKKKRKRKAADS